LLFFTAGNIFYANHAVNMDTLGGLAKNMPYTSYAFLIGAIAISGIPPFNGFISEFLIYFGVVNHLSDSAFVVSILGVACILSLVLIGGLCIYCFTKAFGLSFLGTRRQEIYAEPKEVPASMLVPAVVLISFILAIGLMPAFFASAVLSIVHNLINVPSSVISENAIHSLTTIGHVNVLLIGLGTVIIGLRAWQQSKVKITYGATWGCGYSAGDFRHQYTPTSYADSLRQLADPAIDFHKNYTPFPEDQIFPMKKEFHTESKDLVEEKTILSWVNVVVNNLPRAGIAQSGFINHYLMYPVLFLILIGLLMVLNLM